MWLERAAVILFALSFALPAADLGPAGRPAARGLMAAPLAALVLPLSVRALADARRGTASVADAVYTAAAGVYFAALFLANAVMVYGLAGRRARHRAGTDRLVNACAMLVWGALLVDYHRIYRALDLADADDFRLRIGFYVWALSFALLAVARRTRTAAVIDPPSAAR